MILRRFEKFDQKSEGQARSFPTLRGKYFISPRAFGNEGQGIFALTNERSTGSNRRRREGLQSGFSSGSSGNWVQRGQVAVSITAGGDGLYTLKFSSYHGSEVAIIDGLSLRVAE